MGKFTDTLGIQSPAAIAIFRIAVVGFGILGSALMGLVTWDASKALSTLDAHTAALSDVRTAQEVAKTELKTQSDRLDAHSTRIGAMEGRQQSLETTAAVISGKLDTLIDMTRKK